MRTTKTWTISLPPKLGREAERTAREENRTKSELVREALRMYLEELRTEEDVDRLVHEARR